MKVKNVAVIDDRTAFGQGVAEEFTKEAKNKAWTIAGQGVHDRQAGGLPVHPDLTKAKQPESHLLRRLRTPSRPHGALVMKQLGLTAKLLGGDTLCSPGSRQARW